MAKSFRVFVPAAIFGFQTGMQKVSMKVSCLITNASRSEKVIQLA